MNDLNIFEQLIHLDLQYVERVNKLLEGEQEKDILDKELEALGIVEINSNHTNIKIEYEKVLNSSLKTILNECKKSK
jgi:hypothetical protein